MESNEEVLIKASEWLKSGRRFCLATIVSKEGSGPRPVGSRMIIAEDGETFGSIGGGRVEQEVKACAARVMAEDLAAMLALDLSGKVPEIDAYCGGKLSVLLEAMGSAKNLFIFGAGHVGRATARLASEVGFNVTLVDCGLEAGDGITGSNIHLVSAAPQQVRQRLRIDRGSLVVICTGAHSLDQQYLEEILPIRPAYLGMLGSKNKAKVVVENLEKEGFQRDFLESIHIPIGLDIGAITPEEIAVSIVAQLILETRGGRRKRA